MRVLLWSLSGLTTGPRTKKEGANPVATLLVLPLLTNLAVLSAVSTGICLYIGADQTIFALDIS